MCHVSCFSVDIEAVAIERAENPDWVFAPNGAVEAAAIAKKQGKVRFIGFTGHKNPEFHLAMLKHVFPPDIRTVCPVRSRQNRMVFR